MPHHLRRALRRITSAQSVTSALEQAKTAMQMASLDDSELPQIRTREDVVPAGVVRVQPTGRIGA